MHFTFLLYSKFTLIVVRFRYFYKLLYIIYLFENAYRLYLVLVFLRLWKWSSFFWNILPIVLENNLVLLCSFSLLIDVVNRMLRWIEFYQGVSSPPKYSFCIFLYNVIFMFMFMLKQIVILFKIYLSIVSSFPCSRTDIHIFSIGLPSEINKLSQFAFRIIIFNQQFI